MDAAQTDQQRPKWGPAMTQVKLASLRAAADFDASGYTQGAQQVEAANRRMEQSQVGVTQSVSQTERRIQESTSAYDRLIRQLDPAAAAQARLATQTEKVNRWLEQGRITAEQHARAMQLLNQRYGTASVAAQQFGAANENAGNTGRRLGQALGQAGFQVQDFASQIAGGQSALVAFGQQGSQLLGIFGPAGAIAGALLTVGVLALQLSGTAESVRDLSRANEELIRDWQKLQDLGDTEADAQTRRIERNREEARSIYERVKASLTLSEDVVFRQLRDEQNAVDEARAQVAEQRRLAAAAAASPFTRDGTPATPINDNAIATAEARVQRTQTLVEKLQADLARVEREFDRALTNIDAGAMNRGDERVRSLRAAGDATADLARAERERIALANQIERDLQDAIERENALVEARRASVREVDALVAAEQRRTQEAFQRDLEPAAELPAEMNTAEAAQDFERSVA
jgi:hypothetical protein